MRLKYLVRPAPLACWTQFFARFSTATEMYNFMAALPWRTKASNCRTAKAQQSFPAESPSGSQWTPSPAIVRTRLHRPTSDEDGCSCATSSPSTRHGRSRVVSRVSRQQRPACASHQFRSLVLTEITRKSPDKSLRWIRQTRAPPNTGHQLLVFALLRVRRCLRTRPAGCKGHSGQEMQNSFLLSPDGSQYVKVRRQGRRRRLRHLWSGSSCFGC